VRGQEFRSGQLAAGGHASAAPPRTRRKEGTDPSSSFGEGVRRTLPGDQSQHPLNSSVRECFRHCGDGDQHDGPTPRLGLLHWVTFHEEAGVDRFGPLPIAWTFYGHPHVRAVRNGVRIPRRPPLELRGPTTGRLQDLRRLALVGPPSALTDWVPRRPLERLEHFDNRCIGRAAGRYGLACCRAPIRSS
jgi:hypothetical protein